MKTLTRIVSALVLAALATSARADRTAQTIQTVAQYTYAAFPLYGGLVTQSDVSNLPEPGFIRADADGAVTAICFGNTSEITLNLVKGEYFPCLVKKVLDTGTDAIVLHVFY